MSSSLLYQALGVRQYCCLRTTRSSGTIAVQLEQDKAHYHYVKCGSSQAIRQGTEERTILAVPLGNKPVDLCLFVPRLGCQKCGSVRLAAIAIARPLQRVTHAFERYALDLLSHMTIQAVADHLQVGWDLIKTLFKRRLQFRIGLPKL